MILIRTLALLSYIIALLGIASLATKMLIELSIEMFLTSYITCSRIKARFISIIIFMYLVLMFITVILQPRFGGRPYKHIHLRTRSSDDQVIYSKKY